MRYCAVDQSAKSIVLIGMMGAGKSSVGRCLQRRTRLALLDTDEIVVSHFGMPISEIFSKHGENAFRDAETQTLRKLAPAKQSIIVTGGGIVLRNENARLLKQIGIVVWLDGNEELLFQRAERSRNRPLLQCDDARHAFAGMLSARTPLYAKLADMRVDTSMLTGEEVGVAILTKLRRFGENGRSR
jgi:shikimate kinase